MVTHTRSAQGANLTGYLHPDYPGSFVEFGNPRELPHSGGWILERRIDGFEDQDAMGCYPLFVCRDWSRLQQDLAEIGDDLVSLGLVTDPFGDYDQAYLRRCFGDLVIPFKEHFVVDLENWDGRVLDKSTRRRIRRAFEQLEVEVCPNPQDYLEDWIRLYELAIARFGLSSLRAFSRSSFMMQFDIPGLILYRAIHQGQTIGIHMVFRQGEVAYGHLIAFDDIGYRLGASYALDAFTIEHLSHAVRWLDLGGASGLTDGRRDGLSEYKSHWTSTTRKVYFCGRIFNPKRYAKIAHSKGLARVNYFPAYRKGEFG